jgi:hypothetical protein
LDQKFEEKGFGQHSFKEASIEGILQQVLIFLVACFATIV